MNFVRKIYSKQILSVLDFGSDNVIVLIARKTGAHAFEVLGAGNSAAKGVRQGVITDIGDAVEAVVEALGKAERAAGTGIETLYFNLNDPEIQSVIARGSKHLPGEGEIRRSDVEQAGLAARRLVDHFDRCIVYFKELEYVVDDRDHVTNAVGVFGDKLEVVARVLQARSKLCEDWLRLMQRAHVKKSASVFSGLSTAYGILPGGDRVRKRFIVDEHGGLVGVFVFANNGITDYTAFPAESMSVEDLGVRIVQSLRDFSHKHEAPEEIILTQDAASDEPLERTLIRGAGVTIRRASPLGVERLNHPKYTGVVGLLHVADELERKTPALRKGNGVFAEMRERVVSYINEYF